MSVNMNIHNIKSIAITQTFPDNGNAHTLVLKTSDGGSFSLNLYDLSLSESAKLAGLIDANTRRITMPEAGDK